MEQYFKIGKLVSTFGVKGEMILQHNLGKKSSLKDLGVLFIESGKEKFLPYFIESAKAKSDIEIVLKFEDIHSKEEASKFIQKELWMDAPAFKKYASVSAPASMLGYHIIHEGKDLGEIEEVIEQPSQLLCRITINGKEALIPIHENNLEKVDRKKKHVHVSLPEGLLEIYLGN